MLEKKLNLWDAIKEAPICITTNGTVKKNGAAVMGAGCAKEMKEKWPNFPWTLGRWLKRNGNIVMGWNLHEAPNPIITFPVKHNWWEDADIALIKQSLVQLKELLDNAGIEKVYLPRPGCGNGKLDWETQVKPALAKFMDERIVIVWN